MTKEEKIKKIVDILERRHITLIEYDDGDELTGIEASEIPFIVNDILDLCFADVVGSLK